MKNILYVALLFLIFMSTAFAHEKHRAAPAQETVETSQPRSMSVTSELKMMISHLRQPEYLHMLLNPLPLYGMSAGVFILVVSLVRRDLKEQTAALLWIALVGAITGLVVWYGQKGYDRIYPLSDPETQRWLDIHMDRGEDLMALFYVAGLASLATLWTRRKYPKAAQALVSLTLALAMLCIGAGAWISHAGGQIRHTEFREALRAH